MKGDAKIVEFLNRALCNELTAINQYFLHSKMLKHWGLQRLARHEYQESIDEMKHADQLAERILFLDGIPNFQVLGKLQIGQTVREVLQCDLVLENQGIQLLREAVVYADRIEDFVSRQLLIAILSNEEEHIDWLETQLSLIERLGESNYCLTQMENPVA